MTDLEKLIFKQRCDTYRAPFGSESYYFHLGKAAELVRKWRESNTLRSVDGQK